MSTLASYFNDALTNIEPDTDKANAATAHAEVTELLKASKELEGLGLDPILIGSYAREVSIKRVKDVDIFVRMESPGTDATPEDVLGLFEGVLSKDGNYGSERVEKQHRSIKIDFSDYDLTVDVVPARRKGENWEVPSVPDDEESEWIETNPVLLNEKTTELNQLNTINDKGIYVPVVKLIRQTRRTWLGDQPGGLFFELMTYWGFTNSKWSATSIAEYYTLALEYIASNLSDIAKFGLDDPTIPGKSISTKADDNDFTVAKVAMDEASKLAREALEDEDDCSSALKWQKLLGKTPDGEYVFQMPSYCNADGTKKNASNITSGARNVPAGNDRYA